MGTAGKPGVNPAHKLMSKLQENRHSLHIARVPDKAKEEHEARIQGLEAGAYRKIENQVEAEPEVKGKKMLDGKIKRIGGIEK